MAVDVGTIAILLLLKEHLYTSQLASFFTLDYFYSNNSQGIYLISSPIIVYYNTQMVGNVSVLCSQDVLSLMWTGECYASLAGRTVLCWSS